MKKLLSCLLVLVLLLSATPVAFSVNAETAISGSTGYCTWMLDGTVLTISGYGKMGDYTTTIQGSPWGNNLTEVIIKSGVKSIGDYAFSSCKGLTSITIPDGVTSIPYGTFRGCTGLTSITLPNGVTSIGGYAFHGCTGLTSITIPDSVTSIPYGTFRDCTGLTSITIPDSVTSIGEGAFYRCTGLTSITIPNSVTSIGNYAFSDCTGLTSITIPKSVTRITGNAFYNCPDLCIRTPENSYAHQYAKEQGIRYYLTEMSDIAAVPVVADSQKAADGKLEVTLKAADGYEYRCNDGAWQSSPVFGGLDFCVQYRFCQRLAATEQHVAGNASDPLLVMLKDKGRTPEKPIIESKTADSITVAKTEGFEYSLDGQNWQKSHVFKGLEPNKTYTVYQRVAETDTAYAGESSEGTTVVTLKNAAKKPSAPIIESKTADSITVAKTEGFEYSLDGQNWQKSHVFKGLEPNKTYTVYQLVAETDTTYASESSVGTVVTTLKNTVAKPSAPVAESKTTDTVTLKKIAGYEYRMDSGAWQKSPVFTGLAPNSTHRFYQRVAETDAAYASDSSTALTVQLDPPFARGDLDGDEEITDWDGVLLARYLAGWNVDISNVDALDIDGDGEITDWDGVLLDRYLAGWDIKIS